MFRRMLAIAVGAALVAEGVVVEGNAVHAGLLKMASGDDSVDA